MVGDWMEAEDQRGQSRDLAAREAGSGPDVGLSEPSAKSKYIVCVQN